MLYVKKFNELTPADKNLKHDDYVKNKNKFNILQTSDGIKIELNKNNIKLVQNTDNFIINYIKPNLDMIPLIQGESYTITNDNIDKLIIECDLIPYQFFCFYNTL